MNGYIRRLQYHFVQMFDDYRMKSFEKYSVFMLVWVVTVSSCTQYPLAAVKYKGVELHVVSVHFWRNISHSGGGGGQRAAQNAHTR